ncbi:hypothetical protein GCM10027184_13130 [Saccharothrix stipae]
MVAVSGVANRATVTATPVEFDVSAEAVGATMAATSPPMTRGTRRFTLVPFRTGRPVSEASTVDPTPLSL